MVEQMTETWYSHFWSVSSHVVDHTASSLSLPVYLG